MAKFLSQLERCGRLPSSQQPEWARSANVGSRHDNRQVYGYRKYSSHDLIFTTSSAGCWQPWSVLQLPKRLAILLHVAHGRNMQDHWNKFMFSSLLHKFAAQGHAFWIMWDEYIFSGRFYVTADEKANVCLPWETFEGFVQRRSSWT